MMELLAPAGGFETLKTAVLYGADAVYLGGDRYGLRAKAKNFDSRELEEAVTYAHAHGVKVHVTVNIIAHNEHLGGLEEYLKELERIGVDALIMADAGMIDIARHTVPEMEIHLSTQASATNYATFEFWHRMGVKRVVAAREVSLAEIAEIRQKVSPDLTIEAFAHGAMCISISGRCLLSNYLAGRDSNLGECTHPCRWQYRLVEETRPGEYFPIVEGEEGTYIFNSKDLCMIEHLPEMEKAGIGSIKIEGRMKSPLYVAKVEKTYRKALDDLSKDPELYKANLPLYKEWLEMASHREYTTGFYLGKPTQMDQIYEDSSYRRSADFVGVAVRSCEDGLWQVEQRGKFYRGDELMAVPAEGEPIPFIADPLYDENHELIDSAPHAKQTLYMSLPTQTEGCIVIRMKES